MSLIFYIIWAIIVGSIARKKGRSFWGYFVLSMFTTPLIGTIVVVCLKNLNNNPGNVIYTTAREVNTEPVYNQNPVQQHTFIQQHTQAQPQPQQQVQAQPQQQTPLQQQIRYQKAAPEPSVKQEPQKKVVRYCSSCGSMPSDGGSTCNICGGKIISWS